MSRCALPVLLIALAIPGPKVVIPALPPTPGAPRVNMPGRPNLNLGFKFAVPSPKAILPALPNVIPRVPAVNMPGRPSLGISLAVPSPKIPSLSLPGMPSLVCPLDAKG